MMRSIVAEYPYFDVLSTAGAVSSVVVTSTLSTLSPSSSFIQLVSTSKRLSYSFCSFFARSFSSPNSTPSFVMSCRLFPLYSRRFCATYSSIGSVKYSTSTPRFLNASRNIELSTFSTESPLT